MMDPKKRGYQNCQRYWNLATRVHVEIPFQNNLIHRKVKRKIQEFVLAPIAQFHITGMNLYWPKSFSRCHDQILLFLIRAFHHTNAVKAKNMQCPIEPLYHADPSIRFFTGSHHKICVRKGHFPYLQMRNNSKIITIHLTRSMYMRYETAVRQMVFKSSLIISMGLHSFQHDSSWPLGRWGSIDHDALHFY